jgi:hypothetical protein
MVMLMTLNTEATIIRIRMPLIIMITLSRQLLPIHMNPSSLEYKRKLPPRRSEYSIDYMLLVLTLS